MIVYSILLTIAHHQLHLRQYFYLDTLTLILIYSYLRICKLLLGM